MRDGLRPSRASLARGVCSAPISCRDGRCIGAPVFSCCDWVFLPSAAHAMVATNFSLFLPPLRSLLGFCMELPPKAASRASFGRPQDERPGASINPTRACVLLINLLGEIYEPQVEGICGIP